MLPALMSQGEGVLGGSVWRGEENGPEAARTATGSLQTTALPRYSGML